LSLLLIAIYVAARLPALGLPIWGEEGAFAHLLIEKPKGIRYILIGRFAGKPDYSAPEHPALIYELIEGAPALARSPPGLRLTFSLFMLSVLLAVLWAVPTAWPLVFAVAISPLAIVGSTALQVDASSGALLVGVLAVLVLGGAPWWLLAVGGTLTGMGKQEWSLALAGAIVVTAFCQPTLRRSLLAIALGLIAGNTASYLYDPYNYLGGIDVTRRITADTGLMPPLAALVQCAIFLAAPLLLAAFAWVSRPRGWPLFLSVYGSILLSGFMLSVHAVTRNEMRYFVPALLVLLCAGAAVWPGGRRWLGAGALAALLVPSGLYLWRQAHTAQAEHIMSQRALGDAVRARQGSNCVAVLSPAYAYDGTFDFVSDSIPREYQEAYASRAGKPLCPH
jgi:hypothetical protein